MTDMLDVIIVGAGAAGLAAGEIFRKNKLCFKILEARERIGGRVQTVQKKFPIELGPEFIHGKAERIKALLSQYQLSSFDIPDLHHTLHRKNLIKLELWDSIAKTLKEIPSTGPDCSMDVVLKRVRHSTPHEKKITRTFIQGFDAALISEVSAQEMKSTRSEVVNEEERKVGRTLEGYSVLLEKLSEKFAPRIQLNSPVYRIEWKMGYVKVFFNHHHTKLSSFITAKTALITLPVGVLKSESHQKGYVEFAPALHSKKQALEFLAMGPVVKWSLHFESDFWSKQIGHKIAMLHTPKGHFQTWWTASPMSWPLITAWSGGDPALEVSSLTKNQQLALVFRELSLILNLSETKLISQLKTSYTHSWTHDPYARGAYSFVKTAGSKARSALARPVLQTLYFAGEATSGNANGTVEGAIESGEKSARLISSRHKS